MKTLLTFCFSGIISLWVYSQNVDPTFNPIVLEYAGALQIKTYGENAIYILGMHTFIEDHPSRFLSRVDAQGNVDKSFKISEQIKDRIDDFGIQSDGKVIIAGSFYDDMGGYWASILRLNVDGSLDNSFQVYQSEYRVNEIVILPNDNIFLRGRSFTTQNKKILDKIGADGEEVNFDTKEVTEDFVIGIGAISKNELVIIGNINYNSTPTGILLMDSIGNYKEEVPSIEPINFVGSMVVSPLGMITYHDYQKVVSFDVYSGETKTYNENITFGQLAQVNETTVILLDINAKFLNIKTGESTAANGFDIFDSVFNVDVSSTGEIYMTGFDNANPPKVVRRFSPISEQEYTEDEEFKVYPLRTGRITSIFPASNGQVYITGRFHSVNHTDVYSMARLNADGSLDESFDYNIIHPDRQVYAVQELMDNKLVISSAFNTQEDDKINGLVITDRNGENLQHINFPHGPQNVGWIPHLTTDQEDNFYAGHWATYNEKGISKQKLVKYNSDGTIVMDLSENKLEEVEYCDGILSDEDNKLLIFGTNIKFDNKLACIHRINADGSLDNTFDADIPADIYIYDIEKTEDGGYVAAGFTGHQASPYIQEAILIWLNSDGSIEVDLSSIIDNSESFSKFIRLVEFLGNGKYLIGGQFFKINEGDRISNGYAIINSKGEQIRELLDIQFTELSAATNIDEESYFIAVNNADISGPIGFVKILDNTSSTSQFISEPTRMIVSPNPATNLLYIQCDNCDEIYYIADITTGKIAQQGRFKEQDKNQIDISLLSSGTYLFLVEKDNKIFSEKIVVVK